MKLNIFTLETGGGGEHSPCKVNYFTLTVLTHAEEEQFSCFIDALGVDVRRIDAL